MKKKTVIIAVLVFALLVIAYIVASFCSIRTVDADSLQVLSRKTEDGVRHQFPCPDGISLQPGDGRHSGYREKGPGLVAVFL